MEVRDTAPGVIYGSKAERLENIAGFVDECGARPGKWLRVTYRTFTNSKQAANHAATLRGRGLQVSVVHNDEAGRLEVWASR